MPVSDAFIVSEDWISESYFTSDATKQSYLARVIERCKDWDARKANLGVSPLTRFSAVRGEIAALVVSATDQSTDAESRADAARALTELQHRTLGYHDRGRAHRCVGPITWVRSTDVDKDVVALVDAAPADSLEDLLSRETGRLTEPWLDEDGKEIASVVPRALSTIFADPDAPDFAVVFAARWVLVAERTRWAEGRYLAIDLQLVADRNEAKRGGEIDSALAAAHADSFIPEADGSVWWSRTLEDSIKHTVGVSQDLREGIRLSIEDIANEVVRRRAKNGLAPLPDDQAQPLAIQSLRFLYRILFLLFAEASPELEVLPTNAADYDKGYSLDRLRELVQVKIESPKAKNGTHFYDSLAVLFRLVDSGHTPKDSDFEHDALTFNALRADLFSPKATARIDEVALGNEALQRVLDRLLLSKKQNNKQRGFISYAELGINQLGAVYEGLMSYTGFFASEPLYEVAPNGDPSKGSWVVPVAHVDADTENGEKWIEPHFVKRNDDIAGAPTPVKHDRGEFVFRLAGRERQQSASYYTPEVLTRFTVSQALEELLDQNGEVTSAEDVLAMTVCEPALGSGAFAIESVRQLAEAYLTRRQDELGVRVDPEEYTRELQRVKAYIALHQVYGVDLNGTAVELAEISLWLDTMAPGLDAPWFGLHLRRGNSLIGARRAVYSPRQVADKSWLKAAPRDVALNDAGDIGAGIHHFLLPAEGWGATAEAKEGKELAPDAVAALKSWRRMVLGKPSKKQVDELASLSRRVEVLWELSRRRLEIADKEVRRAIPVWGRDVEVAGAVTREQIEVSLEDSNGAYRRLRRIMDAWNALWFWPLTDAATGGVTPPNLQQWIDACRMILGRSVEAKPAAVRHGQESLGVGQSWTELGTEEAIELGYAGAALIDRVLAEHPWLAVCESVAERQGFFHWELDFAPVFAAGGFDLQVGNPPWLAPRFEPGSILAEFDPWWQLIERAATAEIHRRRELVLLREGAKSLMVSESGQMAATLKYLSATPNYALLNGAPTDLYRNFMVESWRHRSERGVAALIHYETHLLDQKSELFRAETYRHLRRHWGFINELKLFEIQHQKKFGVNIYGAPRAPSFLHSAYNYHPDTILRSLRHDGTGELPGIKDDENHWDLRPHRSRIRVVTETMLQTWSGLMGVEGSLGTPMVMTVVSDTDEVLRRFDDHPRMSSQPIDFSGGWGEGSATANRIFDLEWGEVDASYGSILQGSHLGVSNPLYKVPRESMRKDDWRSTDLEDSASLERPLTIFKFIAPRALVKDAYDQWHSGPAIDRYRVAWRKRAANEGERTLIPAIIPPGATHVNQVNSLISSSERETVLICGFMSSIVYDFLVRIAPRDDIYPSTIKRLPIATNTELSDRILLRVLRLNTVNSAYSRLWSAQFSERFKHDSWAGPSGRTPQTVLGEVSAEWTPGVLLVRAIDRRQALVEIDALVALSMNLSADELIEIYRAYFPVLREYESAGRSYDANGRLVPTSVINNWKKSGAGVSEIDRTATNQAGNTYNYELPFVTLDREADMRQAYTHFQRVLEERS